MNSELVIASIKPYLKGWKARGNDTRFLNTKIRKGRATGSDDIATELAYLLAEASMNSGGATDSTELQTKYNELVKQNKLLENDVIDLRNEIKTMESDMKDYKYRCDIIVNNTEKTNKVLRQKLDNVIQSWTDDGGEEHDIFNIINRGLLNISDYEFSKVDDPNYDYYSDEVID